MSEVLYVYGIVRAGFDVSRAPTGIDDAPVTTTVADQVSALLSRLSEPDYASGAVETRSGDVAWLSPRAMSHDRVLTWAHDHGGVIPLPMFSMWSTSDSLRGWLSARSESLQRLFDRISDADEFGLRVHRREAVMLEHVEELDAELGALKREALAATPGQRYLLERKIAERAKGSVRAASQRIARDVFESARAFSRDAVVRPLTVEAAGGAEATIVLNAAFLVERARNADFRAAISEAARLNEPRGLAFDFTGPWPPYNFVAAEKLPESRAGAGTA